MRFRKHIAAVFLVVFLAAAVFAYAFPIEIRAGEILDKDTDGNVEGARVQIREEGTSEWIDLGLTGSDGMTEEVGIDDVGFGEFSFDYNITKKGYLERTGSDAFVVGAGGNEYVILEDVRLESTGCSSDSDCQDGKVCGDSGECVECSKDSDCEDGKVCGDSGECVDPYTEGNGRCDEESGEPETSEDCYAVPSGVAEDIQIVSGGRGQSADEVECPQYYSNEGSFVVSDRVRKLCVKYADKNEGDFEAGSYYTNIYLKKVTSDKLCEEGEDKLYQWFVGSYEYVICTQQGEVENLGSDKYVNNVKISSEGNCPSSSFNNGGGDVVEFFDDDEETIYFCTNINGVESSEGCTLSNPKWVNEDNEKLTEAGGWVDGIGGVNFEDYVHGDKVAMIVEMSGCMGESWKFEVYEKSESESKFPFVGECSPGEKIGCVKLSHLSSTAYVFWRPKWFEKTAAPGEDTPDVEYKFVASVQGSSESVESDYLKVNEPEEAECPYDGDISDEDDKFCAEEGLGDMCLVTNECGSLSCGESEDDGCPDGLVCHQGICVECFGDEGEGDEMCQELRGEEEWECIDNKCVFAEDCTFENLEWRDSNGAIIPRRAAIDGFVESMEEDISSMIAERSGEEVEDEGDKYAEGERVNLYGEGKGCENFEDFKFFIKEDRGVGLDMFANRFEADLVPLGSETDGRRGYAGIDVYLPYPLDIGRMITEGNFKYVFYAASAENPEEILGEKSYPIFVERPPEAECNYNPDSEEDDDSCEGGMRCGPRGLCIPECEDDADCVMEGGNNFLCADVRERDGVEFLHWDDNERELTENFTATDGRCYECFDDERCDDLYGDSDSPKEYCNLEELNCVECLEAEDCGEAVEGQEMMCIEGECTSTCESNADCAVFSKGYTENKIDGMGKAERAANKGKTVCSGGQCVQCTQNFNPGDPSGSCNPKETCCFEGTACLEEENRCVQCLEDSICGPGKYCKDNVCVGGLKPEQQEMIGKIVLAIGIGFVGSMIMGPMGALAGLLPLLGGDGGGLGGLLGGILG